MSPVRTMALWCPDWPITAAGFDTERHPVVVVHANRVVAASAVARSSGVRRGLRRREAQARCPDAVVVDADPTRDARAFEPVASAVSEVVPRLAVTRPGVCVFATRGPSRYFGGDAPLARHLTDVVVSVCDVARPHLGAADGPFAAVLAARRGVIVEPGGTPGFLEPMPVSVLDRPDLCDLLVRLGVRTLGQLAALPPRHVLERFGPDGLEAHRLARGLDERPLRERTPPDDLAVVLELDPPVTRVDAVAFAARTLADQLTTRLADRNLACTAVGIEAETEHGETFVRVWRHDGVLRAGAIVERVRWQLDGWLQAPAGQRPSAPLTLLRLVPEEVRTDTGRQLGFWGGKTRADEEAARALARIQGMLGVDAVLVASVGGGRTPSARARFVAWGDARIVDGADEPWPGSVPAPSPASVHPVPLPAEVRDAEGEPVRVSARAILSSAPAHISVDGRSPEAVRSWAGPWPLDERWWDRASRVRAARFQIVTDDGSAHLVSVVRGRWAVEATYD